MQEDGGDDGRVSEKGEDGHLAAAGGAEQGQGLVVRARAPPIGSAGGSGPNRSGSGRARREWDGVGCTGGGESAWGLPMAMTADRARAFGARTPWYRWRCIRGGGTNRERRSRSWRGERRIWETTCSWWARTAGTTSTWAPWTPRPRRLPPRPFGTPVEGRDDDGVEAGLFLVPLDGGPLVDVRGSQADGVLTLKAAPGKYVSSLEVLDTLDHRAWRRPAGRATGADGSRAGPLSPDLLVLEPGAGLPETFEEALPTSGRACGSGRANASR